MLIELELQEAEMIVRAMNGYWRTALERHEPVGQLIEKMTRATLKMREQI